MGSLTHFQMTFFLNLMNVIVETLMNDIYCLILMIHHFVVTKKINIFYTPLFHYMYFADQQFSYLTFWPISHLFRRCVCMFLCTLCIICLTKCLHFQSLDLFFLVLWSFCGQPKWSPYLKEKAILTLEESWILIRERCLSFWDSRLIILLYRCVTVWSLNLVLFESVWKKSWLGIRKEV